MNNILKAIDTIKDLNRGLSDNGYVREANNFAIQALEEKQQREWIPVSERLPEPEKEVEVTVKVKYENGERTFTCRAIYENGKIWRENSNFCWNDFDNVVYDTKRDDWKVPEGWFEAVSYAEEFAVIDDFVIAWRELPEPYKE